MALVGDALHSVGEPVERGATWTTEAPYRETAEAIASARNRASWLAVEKDEANGAVASLRLVHRVAPAWFEARPAVVETSANVGDSLTAQEDSP